MTIYQLRAFRTLGRKSHGRALSGIDHAVKSSATVMGMPASVPRVRNCGVKTKNFHWHLAGTHFRDYHLLFDEHADQIFDAIDVLAERVRKVDGTTIRSIGHISQLQTLADDNQTFVPAPEMVRRLMEDNGALVRAMRAAHEVCERCRDVATTSQLETFIDEAERRTWFLYEVTQGKGSDQ